ncbi:hypothetical protein B0A49_05379 [Cryomyces minteri]|uniref:Phosphoglycerate mutase-like protein n=1 Tax=Cryomyces minteri TaxID=331657 RepID=A0A4U0XJL4_9PEZI|nr:hypothetical protein B0A49_05379 [Cryomyces minteri]
MKLFFIRHGETVDNVAGVYAGIRDSALTSHGFQQAQRLGQHFNTTSVTFTHIFSSHLQRAFKTGEAIRAVQTDIGTLVDLEDTAADAENPLAGEEGVRIIQLPLLAEQDFGYYEGKPFYARVKGSNTSGKDAHHEEHKNDPGFVDVESKESMAKRSDIFLDEHLLPLIQKPTQDPEHVVAIVSHGIFLGNHWRCLLRRLPPRSVQYTPEVRARNPGRIVLEHLGGWSNTGYLELDIKQSRNALVPEVALADSNSNAARSPDGQIAGEPVVTEEDASVPLERPFEHEP